MLNGHLDNQYLHSRFDADALARLDSVMRTFVARGCVLVNLPWLAPDHIMQHTKPAWVNRSDPATMEGSLVASGEQSFLWLHERGDLPPNRGHGYIGFSACFRLEEYDAYHHHYFLKAELFAPATDEAHAAAIQHAMLRDVRQVWSGLQVSNAPLEFAALSHVPSHHRILPIRVRDLGDQMDLEINGVELGSYGIRHDCHGDLYVFGTALAEPRFGEAVREYRRELDLTS